MTVPMLTTSERRTFKRCPQRWEWEYRQGLVNRSGTPSSALWFGIGIHEALAAMYLPGTKRDKHFIGVWETYCDDDEISRAVRDADTDTWTDARALGVAMLQGYVEEYNWDKHADIIAIESQFQLGIPDPRSPDEDIVTFTSTYDGVYRDKRDKLVKLWEHKTAKAIDTKHLSLDDQGGSYWASAQYILRDRGILGPKESIDAITYNFLKKAHPEIRPQGPDGLRLNKDGTVSKKQPGPLFHREDMYRNRKEQATQIKRIASEAVLMDQFRNGHLEIIKTPTRDCSWECPFFSMCELDERGENLKEYKDAVYVRRSPYDRYRKNA